MDAAALQKIQYGVYIVSAGYDGQKSAQIANCVFQITSQPVQFAISLSKQNFTCELLEKSGKLAISALSEEAPFNFMGKLGFQSGRNTDKFAGTEHIVMQNGAPAITSYATAVYALEVKSKVDLTTHILFIAEVSGMEIIDSDKNTMTYGYYHKVKGGLTAKNAPTYVQITR